MPAYNEENDLMPISGYFGYFEINAPMYFFSTGTAMK